MTYFRWNIGPLENFWQAQCQLNLLKHSLTQQFFGSFYTSLFLSILTFHTFSKDQELRKRWLIEIANRTSLQLTFWEYRPQLDTDVWNMEQLWCFISGTTSLYLSHRPEFSKGQSDQTQNKPRIPLWMCSVLTTTNELAATDFSPDHTKDLCAKTVSPSKHLQVMAINKFRLECFCASNEAYNFLQGSVNASSVCSFY